MGVPHLLGELTSRSSAIDPSATSYPPLVVLDLRSRESSNPPLDAGLLTSPELDLLMSSNGGIDPVQLWDLSAVSNGRAPSQSQSALLSSLIAVAVCLLPILLFSPLDPSLWVILPDCLLLPPLLGLPLPA